MTYSLYFDDCLTVLPTLPAESVDCVISDPPYPEIDREYGRMNEADWMVMMQAVVKETRRILKPAGSAVFILQPNSEKVGRMRLWLWRFMVWAGEHWNIVQDAYWWDVDKLPVGGAITDGLMRQSIKPCIWIGSRDCYRNQLAVLWGESESLAVNRRRKQFIRCESPSGRIVNQSKAWFASQERGGVTPHNVLPLTYERPQNGAGYNGHGAGTPLPLCNWWTRYICPPGGVALDPFAGSGTTGIAAAQNGCSYIGIEKFPKYFPILQERVSAAYAQPRQVEMRVSA